DDPRVARIVEAVRKVEAGEPVEGGERPKVRPRAVRAFGLRHYLMIAAVALLLLTIGGVIAWRSAMARPAPELAVLPFDDLSPTHDKAYFAQGVAEEIQSTLDRKSTRLNSSHRTISYAVFCLKKKKILRSSS